MGSPSPKPAITTVSRSAASWAALLGILLAAPCVALAQEIQPGETRPELPPFAPEEKERGTILPPLDIPAPAGEPDDTTAGTRVYVREIHVRGNTAVSDEELAEVAAPYANRELSFADLQALRDALTLAYVDRGYVTSGALIPTQSLADGLLEVRIVEGRLVDIEVETDGRLREGYVRRRIELGAGPLVDVDRLERRLQLLQQDEHIEAVHASLVPGEGRGEAVLRVRVVEARPWRVRFAGNNYSSPVVGGGRGELRASWNNLSGWGDSLSAHYMGGVGLQEVHARYAVPLTAWDTTLDLHFRHTWSEVVEAPFDDLGIESEIETYGFTLTQPLHRTRETQLEAFLTGEWRRSDSFLFGDHFSFVSGPDDGVAKLTVLRFGGSFTWRTRNQVIAARSMVSAGLPWLGATRNSEPGVPDAEFVAWLGQLQWTGRFPELFGLQIVARGDVQLADRPLFGIEQFSIGGHATVRGYREYRLVRDNGVVGSVELRLPVPLPSWREWQPRLEIAPFFDAGYSWNTDRPETGPTTLLSAGIGGRLRLFEGLDLQVYWGKALKDIPTVGGTLQDDGVHLGAVWELR